MSKTLNNIKATKATAKKRKRIGRGKGSGTGTYAGKGLKGQNARAGVSGLKKLGMRQILLKTPKLRGFKSLKPKPQVVNLAAISKVYKDGEKVDKKSLSKHGLIDKISKEVKILGDGELMPKNLKFFQVNFSKSAKEKIEKSGGSVK